VKLIDVRKEVQCPICLGNNMLLDLLSDSEFFCQLHLQLDIDVPVI
jgi:hypothetical protein